jgi:hypothetical protein
MEQHAVSPPQSPVVVAPTGWQPVQDFTLHRYAKVPVPGFSCYQLGTTCLVIRKANSGWSIVPVLKVFVGMECPYTWQRDWCVRHGLIHATWDTRAALLHDLYGSHGIEPLLGPVQQRLRLQRIGTGSYRIPHTDIYVQRYSDASTEWVIGRTPCTRQRGVRRLSLVTSALQQVCASCDCQGCTSQTIDQAVSTTV